MYDLSNICTLCLVRNQNLISIVSQDTDGTVVEEKLRIFLLELINFKPNIQKYICNKCLANLNYIYTFRLKWLENITTLNEYVQKLEVNEPNIKLSVTISDMKYGKVVSLELGNQYHSETSENELQNNCPQGNVTQDRVFITKEIADINNVSTENTNFVQEYSQTNLPVDVKIEIDKAQEISLQDNVVVKQSIDEHVEENFFEDNFSMKIEHVDTFNNFQTPYKIFEEFNEEKHIVEEHENIIMFNLGEYRRHATSAYKSHEFFRQDNKVAMAIRTQCAMEALRDVCQWLDNSGEVAVFDATNSTMDRRKMIHDIVVGEMGYKLFFVESVCDDPEIIEQNIMEVQVSSPDYQNMNKEAALQDFLKRIEHYQERYQPLDEDKEKDRSATACRL